MDRRLRFASLVLALLTLASAIPAMAESATDWPQFRGHHRNGMSPETGILQEWPEGGPEEVWRVPLGEGYSAVTVVDGRLYTMYGAADGEEKRELAAAFDAATGKELWRHALGEKLDTEFGNGPRSTPAVDNGTVYVMDSHGNFAALAADDGSEKWAMSLTEKFGSERPYWGFSTSALIEGDMVLVESGGKEGKCYAALDKQTGDTLWTVGDAPAGYNSPLPVTLAGQRQFIFVAGQKIGGLSPDGKMLWAHDWKNPETHAMPIFVEPDKIYVSGTGDEGASLLRVGSDGDETTVEEVWKNNRLRNHFSSSLLHDGHIYGFDNATLKAVSAETGELAWAKRGLGKGSLIAADGRLIVLSDRGKLVLAEASSAGWSEKGSVQALSGKCWTAPTLSGGRLYLRDHSEMVSYNMRN